jgi:hypothetical protein
MCQKIIHNSHPTATHLLRQRRRAGIDPRDPQPFIILVDFDDTSLTERHDEARERDPSRSIHVHMVPVLDVLVIHGVGAHALRVVPRPEELDKLVLELPREFCNGRPGFRSQSDDLAQVRLGTAVCLEAVLVAHLLLADLDY